MNEATIRYALEMLRARAAATQSPEYQSAADILQYAIADDLAALSQFDYYPHLSESAPRQP